MLKHVSYRSSSTSLSRSYDFPFKGGADPDSEGSSFCFHDDDLSPLASSFRMRKDSSDNVSLTSALSFSSMSVSNKFSISVSNKYSMSTSMLSLNEQQASIPVKIYLRRLRPDMEYKTVSLSLQTNCKELVSLLLKKFRLKHRDPNLFYVLMEVGVRAPTDGAPVSRQLVLEDTARPAELQQCRPKGEASFSIGVKRGGLVKVHDSLLMPGSHYKSMMVSYNTTAEELIQLLLNCYNLTEDPRHYCIHEVCRTASIDRKVRPDQSPIRLQAAWPKETKPFWSFVLRRNISYTLNMKSKLRWRRSLDQSSTDTEPEQDEHDTSRASIMSSSSTLSNISTLSSSSGVSSDISSSELASKDMSIISIGSSFEVEAPLLASTPSRFVTPLASSPIKSITKIPPKPVPRTLFPLTPPRKSPSSVTLTNEDVEEDSGIVVDEEKIESTPTGSHKEFIETFRSPMVSRSLSKSQFEDYSKTLPKDYSKSYSKPHLNSDHHQHIQQHSKTYFKTLPKPTNYTENRQILNNHNKTNQHLETPLKLQLNLEGQSNLNNESPKSYTSSQCRSIVTLPKSDSKCSPKATDKIDHQENLTKFKATTVPRSYTVSKVLPRKPDMKFATIRSLSKSTTSLDTLSSGVNLQNETFASKLEPQSDNLGVSLISRPLESQLPYTKFLSTPIKLRRPKCGCQRCFYI